MIWPNNLSSPFFAVATPEQITRNDMMSEGGQHFAMRKGHSRLPIKSLLLCVLRNLLRSDTKMMQDKLASTKHDRVAKTQG